MAVRKIVTQENPVLRKIASPVVELNQEIETLLDDMAETMYAAEGVGLAAVQVGVLKRVIVADVGEGIIELINPELVEYSGEQFGPEGCLSIPGFHADVSRYEWVRVTGLNRQGQEISLEGNGLLARCLQHEIDHLNGILFIDYLDEDVLEALRAENTDTQSIAE